MKIIRKRGDTSNILQIFIQDSSSTTGAGLTGLVFNTASLVAYYHKDTDTTATAITLVTMTVGTFTSSGFKEIDATNMPGWYQFCPPDAALSASGTPHSVAFHLKGATNMAPLPLEVQLVAVDVEDTVRAGLTALPNAAAEAAGGLYTRGTGAGQIRQDANGRIDANAKAWIDGTIPAVNVTGVPKVDVVDWLGTAPSTPTVAGVPNVNAKTWNDLATVALPLVPTTAGRTLDVSAGGEAGLDWANVGTPSTAVNLSATTVNLANTVTTLTNLPAITANWLTAAGIAASALNGKGDWNIGKTGYALSAAGVQAIWDALTSALTTVGSIGKLLVDNITGNAFTRLGAPVGASISADIAAVKTDTAAVKVQTDKLTFTGGTLVQADVIDWKSSAAPAMTGDAYAALTGAQAEPAQGAPAVNASPLSKLAYLFKAWRNKSTQTSTTYSLYADDAATVDQKATVSDDGTTFTRGEVATGP